MHDKTIPAVLLLQDGTSLPWQSVGAIGTATGEICFNTGMTATRKWFTDPELLRADINYEYGACG